jgi:hypothetical protein
MARTSSVVDEVLSLIPQHPGVRPWWERLDAKQAELAESILEAWHSGKFGPHRRPAARAISHVLKRHGVSIGEQGVDLWLKRNAAKS